ncbi:MAG TPA: 2'-5' RNA ligase family protein [Aggregatilineales bacterium]|nr:2'-5' RNA ligase family protein [Aggregatilineales bacterium]
MSGSQGAAPTKLTTTIMIVAPHEVQAVAVPLLRRYAPDTLTRVPAHLTILYPFVAYERLDEACAKLVSICAEIAPFEITMEGYGEFPSALYMTPRNPQPIKRVFHRVYRDFPECLPYGGAFGDDLTPHMTVGEFETPEELHGAKAALPRYAPITFRATRLHVLYGIDHIALPWITHAVIPLGGAR